MPEFFPELETQGIDNITSAYRLVSRTEEGRMVFNDILVTLCHFGAYIDPENNQEVGQRNVGVAIMQRLGIFSGGSQRVINAMCDLPTIEVE